MYCVHYLLFQCCCVLFIWDMTKWPMSFWPNTRYNWLKANWQDYGSVEKKKLKSFVRYLSHVWRHTLLNIRY